MKKDWQHSEDEIDIDFEEFCPQPVPLSGAGISDKLDKLLTSGKLANFRISNKHTKKDSISFKKSDLIKDIKQGQFCGSKQFRRIVMEDPVTGKKMKFILVDQDIFKELLLDR